LAETMGGRRAELAVTRATLRAAAGPAVALAAQAQLSAQPGPDSGWSLSAIEAAMADAWTSLLRRTRQAARQRRRPAALAVDPAAGTVVVVRRATLGLVRTMDGPSHCVCVGTGGGAVVLVGM
jgi:hypothetical protein